MRHPEFPVISFLCILLLLSSLPSHMRAGSVATVALIAWLAVMSLIRGINAIVWADNFIIKLQVWCDITTKITVGFTYAVPASALCILRHLESVASTRQTLTTKEDKRRRQRFEAIMCFGVPMFFMALHYIVQGHRYDLFEDFGCYPSVYFSVPAILIVYVPPLVMSLTTFVYASLALRHFLRHRVEFAAHLQNSQSAITLGRYFRLMSMAVVEMVWDTGVNIYIIWFNVLTGLRPWISWANVHSNFSRVGVIPEFLNPPPLAVQLIWQWWIIPISCVLFFVFFSFGEEAMADYRAAIAWFRRNILRQNTDKPCPHLSPAVLPTYRVHTHNVNVTLPPTSDDASGHEMKAWDELSLKMPEINEHGVFTSDAYSADPATPAYGEPPFLANKTPGGHPPNVFGHDSSYSLDDSRLTSLDTTESSSFTVARHLASPSLTHNHNDSSAVPTLTVTRPESEVSSIPNTEPSPMIHPPLPAFRPVPSPTASRPTSFRSSMSSVDFGIHVSPAYIPDADTASQYHERACFTPESLRNPPPARPEPTYPHPHGGIRMTVEKSVV